ncbi:MAG: M20/M25/M40 family metallo-hydrolase [Thermoplasmatales archaeon]|nr:M20/M25/M40 family metallo-hydrolase [Thermoplasmatales archaeon]
MMKKIGILIVCMLLIIYTIPVMGLTSETQNIVVSQDPNQDYRSKVKHLDDGRLPPAPGEIAPGFVFEENNVIQIVTDPPEKTIQSSEETIIDILENIDEDLILGYLEDLVDFGPRVTGSGACAAAGDYIYNEFESYGLDARYDDWTYGSYSGNNIEGTLEGIDGSSDEIYVICAHYDSVSGSPGADDDGSGTAAVLAAAYVLSQYEFNHTIRFVAFDGEEQGLLGSYRYVEEVYGNGDNIVAVLNGDMIGYATNPTEASMIKIYENSASSWITDFTDEVNQNYEDYFELTVIPSGQSYGSDHASFWDFNYHSIFYHEYKWNDYYHSPQDIIENMDLDYDTRCSRLMIATLGELAEAQPMSEAPYIPDAPEGPSEWVPDIEATFTVITDDPEGDQIFYQMDWGDGETSDWEGPYPPNTQATLDHQFLELGTYEVSVRAKDIYSSTSEWSPTHTIEIIENSAPETPIISGPTTVKAQKLVDFSFISNDPEGHDIYYKVYWDDGHTTEWLGPYSSGESITLSHAWGEAGNYMIKCFAKDFIGDKSPQASHNLRVTKSRAITNPILQRMVEQIFAQFPILSRLLAR